MEPISVRPIAIWRFSGPTRSLVRLSATGNTPPEPIPARMRDANSSQNDVAIAPRMLATPSSTRHTIISRALPNRSAAAPSTGWMIAKVKANAAAKLAADAMLTPKSSATCGSTGSSARADRLAANVARVMILRAGGRRLDAVTARRSWPTRRNPSAASPTLRTRAAAPCWARPTAHDPDRGGSR